MAFVKILAPLTGGAHDSEVLTGAISAALPFGAHVAGLFVRPDPALAMPFYGEGMSGIVVQEVMDASKETAGRRRQGRAVGRCSPSPEPPISRSPRLARSAPRLASRSAKSRATSPIA